MALTFRTAGAWGPGKGSDLDAVEIDENFYELDTRITDIEDNPPEAVSIDHFLLEGTLLTIVMTNGFEHGPFVLPVAQIRWTGEWAANTQYFIGDIVTNGGSTYFIRVQHISADTFDPGLFTVDGFVYMLVIAKPNQPYDIGLFYNDTIPAGDEVIAAHLVIRNETIAPNFEGARAFLKIATSDTAIRLPIYKTGVLVGTLTFVPGEGLLGDGQYGSFSTVDPLVGFTMVDGDFLEIALPYEEDTTAFGLMVTIPATVDAV